jgi:tryptophan synthase alpha chain
VTNRLTELFRQKKGKILSIYYTAGFPALKDTIGIAIELEKAGADVIEIGIPFSDPVADGPTIQQSNKIALDNGMSLRLLLEQVKDIRLTVKLPIILMGYLNPIMQYGIPGFLSECKSIGIDGLIIPDLPLYEYEREYAMMFEEANLCNTFLISPTTSEERIRRIDAITSGFIYAVSASSTTGARAEFTAEQLGYFDRIRKMELKNPILIGFGISDNKTFSVASTYGAGAIVGSAFITLLKGSTSLQKDIQNFITELKQEPII